jgi:hypothetical protein
MNESSTTCLIHITKLRMMVSKPLGIYETLTILNMMVDTMMTIIMDHPMFVVGSRHGMMMSCNRNVIQNVCSRHGSPVVRFFYRSSLSLEDCEHKFLREEERKERMFPLLSEEATHKKIQIVIYLTTIVTYTCFPSFLEQMTVVRPCHFLTFLEEGEVYHGDKKVICCVEFGSVYSFTTLK